VGGVRSQERGVGFTVLGEGSGEPLSTRWGVWGSAVSSPSWVLANKWFSYILSGKDGFGLTY